MRIQTQVIFFVLCVNVAVIIVLHLNIPGVEYASGLSGGLGSIVELNKQFNVSEALGGIGVNPVLGILDLLWNGFQLLSGYILYFFFGFFIVLQWFGPLFVQDSAGLLAYNFITDILAIVFGALITLWIVEIATGRQLFD